MSRPEGEAPPGVEPMRAFLTTRWSVVLAAGGAAPEETARKAFEALCELYWYPLYAYVRRKGRSVADSQDLTQGFFTALLEKEFLKSVDRERGRFRSFLLTAFQRFLSKAADHDRALKRGGGRVRLSLDFARGEECYRLEPSHGWTPERIFDRRWALTLLERVLGSLRDEQARAGKEEIFDHLKGFLSTAGAPSYKDLAEQTGLAEGALKVAVHRLRRRYRELLHQEIAETVAGPHEIQDELAVLLAALRPERI